jgi:phage tail-like protein
MIPERNNYWLLDSVAGWQLATDNNGGVLIPKKGDVTLDPLPGSATFLDSSLVGCITCPVALAGDCKGRVFVMDNVTNRITILDLSTSFAKRIATLGGPGAGLRHFKTPHSLTVLPSGAIAVADTGNARVQLFSGPPYVLLQVWGTPDVSMKPLAVASDHCGIVYILDGQSRTILRVRSSGEWLEPLRDRDLTNPVELAVGADQTVAVVNGRGAHAKIVIFPPGGGKPVHLNPAAQRLDADGPPGGLNSPGTGGAPLSLVFDGSGNLYAGTANAIVSKLQPDTTQLSGWSLGGEGVSDVDVDGSIAKLAWVQGQGLIGILNSSTPGVAPRLFSMNPAGAYRLSGSLVVGPLDSNIEACSWHRIQITGSVPSGTSVAISSETSEDKTNWTPLVQCAVLSGDNPLPRPTVTIENQSDLDCLVQGPPGRYLRITFNLQSKGAATPQIHAIQVFFPRQSYLQYLPAVLQDDDESRLFLDRFLSIFQTTFDNLDAFIDNLWYMFDPLMTPDNVFPWLAAWLALPVDPTMPLSEQRQLLKGAFQTYRMRGTVAGLQKVIQDYTGVTNIRILEHYRLRNWTLVPLHDGREPVGAPVSGGLNEGARLWSRNFYARLQVGVQSTVGQFKLTNAPAPASEPYDWGANQFSVLFPANPYTASETVAKIEPVLDREKPAYTQAFLCPVFPRLRVGVQATLGVDAYVGKANAMILGKLATLNYDSVLARSQVDRDVQALGLSLYPRVGEDARIL